MSPPRANNKLTRAPVLNLSQPRVKDALKVIDRDELVSGWQQSALGVLDEIELRRREGTLTPRDWKDLTIAGGVSTEKALLAAGQPTEIVANLHAHRHELGPLMDRLARVMNVSPVLKPVLQQHSDKVKSSLFPTNLGGNDALPTRVAAPGQPASS